MTLHGLWPSLSTGNQLEICNQGDKIEVVDDGSELFKEMRTYWLSVTSRDESFWEHEYNKHGYCYSAKYKDFSQKNFFQLVMDLFKKYELDRLVTRAFGEISQDIVNYSYQELKSALQQAAPGLHFELSCNSKNRVQYLKEVRFYFDLDFNPVNITSFRSDCNISKQINIIYS